MGVGDNSKVKEYIDYICSYVKYKEAHKEIKEELLAHLEDRVDEYTASEYASKVMSQEEAISKAIEGMGNGEVVGKQLNLAHKGTPDWITLFLTIVLVNIGAVLMYLLHYKSSYRNSEYLFNHSLLYAIIGTTAIVLFFFFDYRKLQKYSKHIFISMCVLCTLTIFLGRPINGRIFLTIGSFTVDIMSISLYVFVIALAGIFSNFDLNNKFNLIKAAGYLIIPMFFMVIFKGLAYSGIYFITFVVLALKSNIKKRYVIYLVIFNVFSFLFLLLAEPYRMKRFLSFLHPFSDAEGAGYLGVQMYKIAHTSGIFGHGFSANEKLQIVPEMHTDLVFSYIVHTFGWLGAAFFITIFISFIYRILHISKYVRENYGRLLIAGLISIIIVQFTANILMNVNLFPITGIALPFISYGGSLCVANMISVGIIMSVYRRRSLSI